MNTATAEPVTIDMSMVEDEASQIGEVAKPTDILKGAENAATDKKFTPSTAIADSEINKAMSEVDLSNTNSITRFGAAASEEATAVSRQMLDGVRNKDSGPAGEVINDMMLEIRGLDASSIKGGGLLGWFRSQTSRVAKFTQKFETVQSQIDSMTDDLRNHQVTLMTSVATMDRLYDATTCQFHELEVYILAGERLLEKLNTEDIPAMQKIVDSGQDGPDGTPASLMPQALNDLVGKRDQLERKVHDLKMVRMVTIQALPKIRLTQDSDNALISKIDTIVATTIPIWHQEMALALEVAKTQKAADATNNVADATEDMLQRGAEQFQSATLDARKSVERSVVGIEAVESINQTIIDTLDETVRIAEEGKRSRAAADQALIGTEEALRETLKRTAQAQSAYTGSEKENSDGSE